MTNLHTLFKVKTNVGLILGAMVIIIVLFPDLSVYSLLAILISLHQFNLVFNSIGYVIPIRYLFGAFMCLQMLLGPTLAYNGLDSFQNQQFRMQLPEAQYFSYVIPAVIAFIFGLHWNAGKLDGEILDQNGIEKFVQQHSFISYLFIGIGFTASIAGEIAPAGIALVFHLLGVFKFVGAFMIVTGNKRLKIIPLVVIYSSIIASSLGDGMFHDLLTWLIFLGCVLAIKYKPGINVKRGIVLLFILLALAIQQLKGSYRQATWQMGQERGLATMSKALSETEASNNFFSYNSLASSNLRFNQGYIITYIMKNVPRTVPFADGAELYQILESAFLPRIIAPNKLNAGDREIFMKYSTIPLQKGTSMGLSSLGDAYINFGVWGGCIFMFFYGLFFNTVLKAFYKHSKYLPLLLLFTPLVFYYPIRPDTEMQTILGHLVKACFLIYIIFTVWKKHFLVYNSPLAKNIHTHSLVPSRV